MFKKEDFIDGDVFEYLSKELGLIYTDGHDLLNAINNKFILSHNSDACILPEGKRIRPMNLPKPRTCDFEWKNIPSILIKLFAQNADVRDKRIIPIPIGLERTRWFPHLHKREILQDAISKDIKKNGLVYLNAHPNNNVQSRTHLYDVMNNKEWCTKEFGKNGINNYEHFLVRLKSHKFVFCPDGNGMDTHRTWETLYVGSYPIVERHYFTEEFAKELPIVIVDDWSEVTEEFLNDKYIEFNNRNWNWDVLTFCWWKEKISKELK